MEMTVTDLETGETFRSSPARDVARFIPELLGDLCKRLRLEFVPAEEAQFLAAAGVDKADVDAAVAAVYKFIGECGMPDIRTIENALASSGLRGCNKVALMHVLATFGKVCLGAAWAGKRSAMMQGEDPVTISLLRVRGNELLEQLSLAAKASVSAAAEKLAVEMHNGSKPAAEEGNSFLAWDDLPAARRRELIQVAEFLISKGYVRTSAL